MKLQFTFDKGDDIWTVPASAGSVFVTTYGSGGSSGTCAWVDPWVDQTPTTWPLTPSGWKVRVDLPFPFNVAMGTGAVMEGLRKVTT